MPLLLFRLKTVTFYAGMRRFKQRWKDISGFYLAVLHVLTEFRRLSVLAGTSKVLISL